MSKVDWTALIKRQRAASALTYGLIVGLVAVLSIGAVQSVGDSVTALFSGVAEDLGSAGESTPTTRGEDTPTPPTPNQPPSLTAPADQTIPQDTATAALPVTLADPETAPAALTLSATSDSQTLVPDANINLGGTDANRTVTITPATGQIGTATIILTVTDAAGDTATASFEVSVLPAEIKLTADDAAADDEFGVSVAIDGDTAVIGARDGDASTSDTGAAYVFIRSGTGWTQQQKLTAFDAADGDEFGRSVAVDGDTAFIGTIGADNGVSSTGAAYVFTRSGGNWTQQQKLTASNAQAGDNFGFSIALNGGTALIGTRRGAYVFVSIDGNWVQQQELIALDAPGDGFGRAVALDGDTAVIGSRFDNNTGGDDAGAAYIFTRSNATWTQQQKLFAEDAAERSFFGTAVAIVGDTAMIGAPSDDEASFDAGAVYVFTRSNDDWTHQQKLIAQDASEDGAFGNSISMVGDRAVIGAPFEDADGLFQSGAAYVFARSGSTWSQQRKLIASDAVEEEGEFGHSVALSGDTAVIGAHRDSERGSGAGAAYVVPLP